MCQSFPVAIFFLMHLLGQKKQTGLHQTKKVYAQQRKPSTKWKDYLLNRTTNSLTNDTPDKGLISKIYWKKYLYNSTPTKQMIKSLNGQRIYVTHHYTARPHLYVHGDKEWYQYHRAQDSSTTLPLILVQQGYEILQLTNTGTVAAQRTFQHSGYREQFKE